MVVTSTTSLVQTWLPAVASILVGGGALVAAFEYRLKARTQRLESQIRLADAFARLVPIADGRSGSSLLSETAVEHLLNSPVPARGGDVFRESIVPAVLPAPVGIAAQIAALASIAELVDKNPKVLKEPGVQALKQLEETVNVSGIDALKKAHAAAMQRVAGLR